MGVINQHLWGPVFFDMYIRPLGQHCRDIDLMRLCWNFLLQYSHK